MQPAGGVNVCRETMCEKRSQQTHAMIGPCEARLTTRSLQAKPQQYRVFFFPPPKRRVRMSGKGAGQCLQDCYEMLEVGSMRYTKYPASCPGTVVSKPPTCFYLRSGPGSQTFSVPPPPLPDTNFPWSIDHKALRCMYDSFPSRTPSFLKADPAKPKSKIPPPQTLQHTRKKKIEKLKNRKTICLHSHPHSFSQKPSYGEWLLLHGFPLPFFFFPGKKKRGSVFSSPTLEFFLARFPSFYNQNPHIYADPGSRVSNISVA